MEVFLIFKTHLDVGYTDYAKTVVDNYINTFIPNAIRVGYELKDTDTPFVWTTGSWLIWEALKRDKDGTVEQAIRDGIIAWHGLPFTTHTELMTKELFEYGISISEKLDARFGKKTIAAKMTDVHAHTIGMVPICKKHGIEFLHLGVNPANPILPVPSLFKWKCDDSEITVMYQGDYGEEMQYDDFAIYFAHTGDNQGPQSGEEIKEAYRQVSEKYPGAKVRVATLDDVAEKLRNIDNLPVIDKELGDTWIHGVGTDPKKLSKFRTLQRYASENGIGEKDLSDNLLMVPEHTWGMNVRVYFPDIEPWHEKDLFSPERTQMRERIEASWTEQRGYIKFAEKVLGVTAWYDTSEPDLAGFEETVGSLSDIELSWQIFDNSDCERYKNVYMKLTPQNQGWALWDFVKKGLPDYRGGIYTAKTVKAYKKDKKEIYRLEFDKAAAAEFGLPHFWVEKEDGRVSVKWINKKAEKIPQACWIKFLNQKEDWELDKMGRWIRPEEVIGSPLISAVDKGIRNSEVEITTLDAALAAPFGRRLYDYELKPTGQDMYFNLYNNIWNTNFPMWYSDDAVFRFEIKKRTEKKV